MNILMVYQSVVDMCASFFLMLHTVIKVDGTGLSRNSVSDQLVCIWLGWLPLYYFLTESTYGILLTTLDRYSAVLYPIWYKTNVSRPTTVSERTPNYFYSVRQIQVIPCPILQIFKQPSSYHV